MVTLLFHYVLLLLLCRLLLLMKAEYGRRNSAANLSSFFEFLPQAIQAQLLLERDPHGNVQVAKIETEKMLIEMVETELESRRKQGLYKNEFRGQSHFLGYEGRCGLPSNFDANYCYALGYVAGALLHSGKTGLISSVGNLTEPVEKWTVGGTALASLMDVERRHGTILSHTIIDIIYPDFPY